MLVQKMKTTLKEAARLVASYDALLKVQIAQAMRYGQDEIRISVPRARGFYNDLLVLEKALNESTRHYASQSHFSRLDAIFNEQDRVMNEAMSKIGI